MIPANKIKEISNNMRINLGNSDKTPSPRPLFLALIIIFILYLMVKFMPA